MCTHVGGGVTPSDGGMGSVPEYFEVPQWWSTVPPLQPPEGPKPQSENTPASNHIQGQGSVSVARVSVGHLDPGSWEEGCPEASGHRRRQEGTRLGRSSGPLCTAQALCHSVATVEVMLPATPRGASDAVPAPCEYLAQPPGSGLG